MTFEILSQIILVENDQCEMEQERYIKICSLQLTHIH